MRSEVMDAEHSDELVSLVDAWCNQQAGEEEVARLEEILAGDAGARRYYRRVMNLHAELHARCEDDAPAAVPFPAVRQSRVMAWGGWAVAAALALLLVGWAISSRSWNAPSPDPVVADEAPPETIGLLVSQSGAKFTGGEEELPIRFEEGDYELETGIVHVRLANGVDVVMRGPARFGMRDALHISLDRGVMRAIVPHSGHGFVIEAPEMLYEDLGTEFGVSVDEGDSEMHVFSGQVNARKKGPDEGVSAVYGGESLRQVGADVTVDKSQPSVEFPAPEDVGFEAWKKQRPLDLMPGGLIAYFPFVQNPDEPEVLENVVSIGGGQKLVSDAKVVGARWVSGRWSGKGALLFDRPADRVELEVPGEFNEISMAAWLHIDHLDHALNAIFTSDGWNPGALHWQVMRSQDPLLAVHETHESGALLRRPVRLGRWVHVVAVVSKKIGRTRFYVDGQLAQENPLPADILIRPGKARLGNWLVDETDLYTKRNLKGRMDEFAIWNRALSGDEVAELTRAGAPSMLMLAERLKVISSPRYKPPWPRAER